MNLDEIYDRYGEKMYQFLALRLGSAQDAEDVLQEAFCRLSRYSWRWGLVRDPRAYVFRVLRNESNRFLKRRINSRAGEATSLDKTGRPGFILDPGDQGAAAAIAQGLAHLPAEQKEVILLKVTQDFTFKEIAAICGLSINTVASRYRYGIERLRSRLEGKL
jgi:RNA polymerase sigma-70 factor (ECF subfamily)